MQHFLTIIDNVLQFVELNTNSTIYTPLPSILENGVLCVNSDNTIITKSHTDFNNPLFQESIDYALFMTSNQSLSLVPMMNGVCYGYDGINSSFIMLGIDEASSANYILTDFIDPSLVYMVDQSKFIPGLYMCQISGTVTPTSSSYTKNTVIVRFYTNETTYTEMRGKYNGGVIDFITFSNIDALHHITITGDGTTITATTATSVIITMIPL